jgi:hypothetical protein
VTRLQAPVSRPLRAFGIVIAGWLVIRAAVLWHAYVGMALPLAQAKLVGTARSPFVTTVARGSITALRDDIRSVPVWGVVIGARLVAIPKSSTVAPTLTVSKDEIPVPDPPRIAPWLPQTNRARRFTGSAWAFLRPESASAALGTGGTLGGSQDGARIFYETGMHPIALTARISAPLAIRTGREASIGVALRGRAFGLLLERRIALDNGARNAMSVTAYGGVSDVVLPHGFVLDGYAQFGIVGLRSRDGFGDGAVRITRPILRWGAAKLSFGGIVSGGAQPGVARLDVGPELAADLPVAAMPVRVTVGWRQRVAGDAVPGSGPSVSIGFGF